MTRCLTISLLAGLVLLGGPRPANAKDRAALDAQLEALVAKHLGIFVTVPKQRDPSEHVAFEEKTLTIGVLRPVSGDISTALCDGGRWLLAGRLSKTQGARALFVAARRVDRIRLEFVDIKTTVHPSEKGMYEQHRSVVPQMTFELSRAKALQLDPKVLRKTLRGSRCPRLVRTLLDRVWVKGD